MFVDRLTSQQQGALLSIAGQLIECDQKISAQETTFLHALRKQIEGTVEPIQISVSDLPDIFTTSSTKAAFLLELLGLAHADAEYHLTEKAFITNIATAMGISEPLLADMASWVCRQFALVREAEEFMGE